MLETHKSLHSLLTKFLYNDELAADYLLCHLVASVFKRTDMKILGAFSLNIYDLPTNSNDYTKKLYEIMELLLPASHFIPIGLKSMNSSSYWPKKNYDKDRIEAGLLQLAPKTHLVLDETGLETGQFNENGVKAIRALSRLLDTQEITCDFQHFEVPYEVNVPTLILSKSKSVLSHDFALPLQPKIEMIEDIDPIFETTKMEMLESLNEYRTYLTLAETTDYGSNDADNSLEFVENDFIKMRNDNTLKTTNDLHGLLELGRQLSIARGYKNLNTDCWELAKKMENERKERLKKVVRH